MATLILILLLGFAMFKIIGLVSASKARKAAYENNRVIYSYKEILSLFKEFNIEKLIPDEIYNKAKEDLLNNENNIDVLRFYSDKIFMMNRGGRIEKIREYRRLLINGVITQEDYLKKRDEEVRKHYEQEYELHFYKGEPLKIELGAEEGWDVVFKILEDKGIKDYKSKIDYILRKSDNAHIFMDEELGKPQRRIKCLA